MAEGTPAQLKAGLEHELKLMEHPKPRIKDHCLVLDTLSLAREIHPGQRNSLDALCKRYEVDSSQRAVHGALIDSELLAHVYLAMTGGQTALLLDAEEDSGRSGIPAANRPGPGRGRNAARTAKDLKLKVIKATEAEAAAHEALLERIRKSGSCVWDDVV